MELTALIVQRCMGMRLSFVRGSWSSWAKHNGELDFDDYTRRSWQPERAFEGQQP